ncbi:hypothetical protein HYPSUDRAFT_206428 [Hypholoma sublateritium FD-334 SS-4]|uniref:Uncharacterized protein n=1 Tax=Hypholoma sublateritium (strain FD-334 SS-4) TaxID=945553 RepID=A0A0D2KR90_HYPSF|nr:hypothetical protein HYPSUDRAFT_206428 [Hypholoma sublateritium FD-334 SS-4]
MRLRRHTRAPGSARTRPIRASQRTEPLHRERRSVSVAPATVTGKIGRTAPFPPFATLESPRACTLRRLSPLQLDKHMDPHRRLTSLDPYTSPSLTGPFLPTTYHASPLYSVLYWALPAARSTFIPFNLALPTSKRLATALVLIPIRHKLRLHGNRALRRPLRYWHVFTASVRLAFAFTEPIGAAPQAAARSLAQSHYLQYIGQLPLNTEFVTQ